MIMKYRVTLTLTSNTNPFEWIDDTIESVLYKKGERLIDVGIVELEDEDG